MPLTGSCLDNRIRKLIKSCTKRNHRSLFVILGRTGSEKVSNFLELLKQNKISSLWCAKDCHKIKLKSHSNADADLENANSDFHCCSYKNVYDFLHNTYDLLVLQDFENATLPLLSMMFQIIKGGGIIIFLMPFIQSLSELDSMELNVEHKPSKFCKRFAKSLIYCTDALILCDDLSVLSTPNMFLDNNKVQSLSTTTEKINEISLQNGGDWVAEKLVPLCKTAEQAELLLKFLHHLKNHSSHTVFSISSPVGRGKSALLGLVIAGSLVYNYCNIYISSMKLSNVDSIFKFLLLGLDALNYKEDTDFDLIESVNPKFKNSLIGINVFRDHPQTIRFVLPMDIENKLSQAELVIFDEAAAIPPTLLKPHVSGPYLVLMASSISGCGASSQDLYNKMIKTIQPQAILSSESEKFKTFTMEEPIHYASGDGVENWLNNILCIYPERSSLLSGFPLPESCRLFYMNRDTLFSGTQQAEIILKSLVELLTSPNRSIDPNFLIRLADSPDYHIFCLLPPIVSNQFPGIICAILVHLEKEIPNNIIHCGTNLNDLETQCFNEWKLKTPNKHSKFVAVQGIHILSIVTHQNYRKMGYGIRSFQLLQEFYEGKCIHLLDTNISKVNFEIESPILLQLTEIQPDNIEYFLVSYSLSSESLRFWKKLNFSPAFITESVNSEGEHSLYMVKGIDQDFDGRLKKYWSGFQDHYRTHLGSAFKKFSSALALTLLHFKTQLAKANINDLTKSDIDALIPPHRMKCLEKYCHNLQDFHSILQFIPTLAKLYFNNRFKDSDLSRVQEAILLSFGLQFKTADDVSKDLGLPSMQVHSLLNRTLKQLAKCLTTIIEKSVEKTLHVQDVVMEPVAQTLDDELEEAAKKIREQQEVDAKKLLDLDIAQYVIKGSEDDWQKALFSGRKTLVSIKSIKKKREDTGESSTIDNQQQGFKKTKQQHQKKRRR